jgi:hypothetical protein
LNITQAQQKAVGEFVDLVASTVGKNRAIHPETAISASAQLSGSLLLRSFNLRLDNLHPGTIVLSNEANEKGPMLVNTLAAFLSASNVSLDQKKLGGEAVHRGEQPQTRILDALSQLQGAAIKVGEVNSLSLEQAAQAAALATAFVVKECAPKIGAETAFNVAVYGFIEGSKTVPPRLASLPNLQAEVKPWYKFW